MSVRLGLNEILRMGHHATKYRAVLGTVNARRRADR
jgi:hypothetical protein